MLRRGRMKMTRPIHPLDMPLTSVPIRALILVLRARAASRTVLPITCLADCAAMPGHIPAAAGCRRGCRRHARRVARWRRPAKSGSPILHHIDHQHVRDSRNSPSWRRSRVHVGLVAVRPAAWRLRPLPRSRSAGRAFFRATASAISQFELLALTSCHVSISFGGNRIAARPSFAGETVSLCFLRSGLCLRFISALVCSFHRVAFFFCAADGGGGASRRFCLSSRSAAVPRRIDVRYQFPSVKPFCITFPPSPVPTSGSSPAAGVVATRCNAIAPRPAQRGPRKPCGPWATAISIFTRCRIALEIVTSHAAAGRSREKLQPIGLVIGSATSKHRRRARGSPRIRDLHRPSGPAPP